MCTCQCEGPQMGQSNGVLFKEVSAFQRSFNRGLTVYVHIHVHIGKGISNAGLVTIYLHTSTYIYVRTHMYSIKRHT